MIPFHFYPYLIITLHKIDEEKDLSLVDGWWAKRKAKGEHNKVLNAFKAKVLELEMVFKNKNIYLN